MEKNKQTAVQKLADIVESMLAKSFMAPQDKETTVGYQIAAVEIKKYIGGLLLMEKEQTLDFASKVLNRAECSWTGIVHINESLEDIYNEIYKSNEE